MATLQIEICQPVNVNRMCRGRTDGKLDGEERRCCDHSSEHEHAAERVELDTE